MIITTSVNSDKNQPITQSDLDQRDDSVNSHKGINTPKLPMKQLTKLLTKSKSSLQASEATVAEANQDEERPDANDRSKINQINRWSPAARKILDALLNHSSDGVQQAVDGQQGANEQQTTRTKDKTAWESVWERMYTTGKLGKVDIAIGVFDQDQKGSHTNNQAGVVPTVVSWFKSAKNIKSAFRNLFRGDPTVQQNIERNVADSAELFHRDGAKQQLKRLLGLPSNASNQTIASEFNKFIQSMPEGASFSLGAGGGIDLKWPSTGVWAHPSGIGDIGVMVKTGVEGDNSIQFSRDAAGVKVTMGGTSTFKGLTLEVGGYASKPGEKYMLGAHVEVDATLAKTKRDQRASAYFSDENLTTFINKLANVDGSGKLDLSWVVENAQRKPNGKNTIQVSKELEIKPLTLEGDLAGKFGGGVDSPFNTGDSGAVGLGKSAGLVPGISLHVTKDVVLRWKADSAFDADKPDFSLTYQNDKLSSYFSDTEFKISGFLWGRPTKVTYPSISPDGVISSTVGGSFLSYTFGEKKLPDLKGETKPTESPKPTDVLPADDIAKTNRFVNITGIPLTADSLNNTIKKYPSLERFFQNDPDAKWRLQNALKHKTEGGTTSLNVEFRLRDNKYQEINNILAGQTFESLSEADKNKIQAVLDNKDSFELSGYNLLEDRNIKQKRGVGAVFISVNSTNEMKFTNSIYTETVNHKLGVSDITDKTRGISSLFQNRGRALQLIYNDLGQSAHARQKDFVKNSQEIAKIRQLEASGQASPQELADIAHFDAYQENLGKEANFGTNGLFETIDHSRFKGKASASQAASEAASQMKQPGAGGAVIMQQVGEHWLPVYTLTRSQHDQVKVYNAQGQQIKAFHNKHHQQDGAIDDYLKKLVTAEGNGSGFKVFVAKKEFAQQFKIAAQPPYEPAPDYMTQDSQTNRPSVVGQGTYNPADRSVTKVVTEYERIKANDATISVWSEKNGWVSLKKSEAYTLGLKVDGKPITSTTDFTDALLGDASHRLSWDFDQATLALLHDSTNFARNRHLVQNARLTTATTAPLTQSETTFVDKTKALLATTNDYDQFLGQLSAWADNQKSTIISKLNNQPDTDTTTAVDPFAGPHVTEININAGGSYEITYDRNNLVGSSNSNQAESVTRSVDANAVSNLSEADKLTLNLADIVQKRYQTRKKIIDSGQGSRALSAYSAFGTANGLRILGEYGIGNSPLERLQASSTLLGAAEEVLSGVASVGDLAKKFNLKLPKAGSATKALAKVFGGSDGLSQLGKLGKLGKAAGPLGVITSGFDIVNGAFGLDAAIRNGDGYGIASSTFDIASGALGLAAVAFAATPAGPFLAVGALVASAISQGIQAAKTVDTFEKEVRPLAWYEKLGYGAAAFFGLDDKTSWHQELQDARRQKAINARKQLIAEQDQISQQVFRTIGDSVTDTSGLFPTSELFLFGKYPHTLRIKEKDEHGDEVHQVRTNPAYVLTEKRGFGDRKKVTFFNVNEAFDPNPSGFDWDVGQYSKTGNLGALGLEETINTGSRTFLSTYKKPNNDVPMVEGFRNKQNTFYTDEAVDQFYIGGDDSDVVRYVAPAIKPDAKEGGPNNQVSFVGNKGRDTVGFSISAVADEQIEESPNAIRVRLQRDFDNSGLGGIAIGYDQRQEPFVKITETATGSSLIAAETETLLIQGNSKTAEIDADLRTVAGQPTIADKTFILGNADNLKLRTGQGENNIFHIASKKGVVKSEGDNNAFYITEDVQSLRINNGNLSSGKANTIDLTDWVALDNLEVFATNDGKGMRIRDKQNHSRFMRIEDRSSVVLNVQGQTGSAITLGPSQLASLTQQAQSLTQLLPQTIHYVNRETQQVNLSTAQSQLSLKGNGTFHIRAAGSQLNLMDVDKGVGVALDTINDGSQLRFKGINFADIQQSGNTLWMSKDKYALLAVGQIPGYTSFVAQFDDGVASFHTNAQGQLSVYGFEAKSQQGLTKPAGVSEIDKAAVGLAQLDGPLWRFANGMIASPLTGDVYDLQGNRYTNAHYDINNHSVVFNTLENSQQRLDPNQENTRIAPYEAKVLEDGRWLFGDTADKNQSFIVDPTTWRIYQDADDKEPLKGMWFRYDGARGQHLIVDSGSGPGNRLTNHQTQGVSVAEFQRIIKDKGVMTDISKGELYYPDDKEKAQLLTYFHFIIDQDHLHEHVGNERHQPIQATAEQLTVNDTEATDVILGSEDNNIIIASVGNDRIKPQGGQDQVRFTAAAKGVKTLDVNENDDITLWLPFNISIGAEYYFSGNDFVIEGTAPYANGEKLQVVIPDFEENNPKLTLKMYDAQDFSQAAALEAGQDVHAGIIFGEDNIQYLVNLAAKRREVENMQFS
ncbi:hypothetical protein H0A36_22350 [Endozoicomonas sp. SM1973]|uniref:Uncharacterized protein n=1 Tax=Spartinivicinus marinus TaxID=2994442 RepID=A0A853IAD6_9GAMM|nr:hypothetical protein [Spartinivicinus marinus]MCX4029088.1 hypothetical protein [Spartinivicinus marinus]NYZ68762.1 hypothetical protein [Spartinivicinus marinus]